MKYVDELNECHFSTKIFHSILSRIEKITAYQLIHNRYGTSYDNSGCYLHVLVCYCCALNAHFLSIFDGLLLWTVDYLHGTANLFHLLLLLLLSLSIRIGNLKW